MTKPWEYPGAVFAGGFVTIAALMLLEPNDDEHVWRAFTLISTEKIITDPEKVIERLRESLEITKTT
jgi:hypothetical protein